LKSQEWKSSTSKKPEKDVTVQIMIGMMQVNKKEMRLKPKRGKRIALNISSKASYRAILEKAIDKWKSFNSDIYDEREDYVLLLESGNLAQFLPGSRNEPFTLQRYKEEVGRDFNKIVLYLCAESDYNCEAHTESDESDEMSAPTKRMKEDKDTNCVDLTLTESDEKLARELQDQFDMDMHDVDTINDNDNNDKENETARSSTTKTENVMKDSESVLRSIGTKVDQSGQFFVTVRRGASFERTMSLWQRQSKRFSPEKVLRVQYCGERGIDTGAMSQEFLANAILEMGKVMFPDGAPMDSMYNVHNKNFQVCGQIVAVSLAQGGPPPTVMDDSVYQLLVNPDIDMNSLDVDTHFTAKDKTLLKSVLESETFDSALTDAILENGYTGKIDDFHKEDIVGTMKINIITKRLVYLQQFSEGLQLFNAYDVIQKHSDVCKPLFVTGSREEVDANYLFSLVRPTYSTEGSSRRKVEENIMDNFQDFVMALEDENISGYSEALAWSENDGLNDDDGDDGAKSCESVDVTPAGVLGWLTGQRHRPVNGDHLYISVHFDHECLMNNPKHTICFPRVGACSKDVTFPVAHMGTPEEFKKVFLLALCKGNSFAKA